MADYFWIYNGTTAGDFQTAANWSQSETGSPVSGTIPQADDFVHFGHEITIGNNLGRGSCELTNNTNALARLTLHEDYVELTGSSTEINFLATGYMTSNAGGFDFVTEGFKIGMHINITGAVNAGNNGIKQIAAVTTNSIQFTSATGMVNETGTTNTVSFTYSPQFDLNGNTLFLTSPLAGTLLTIHGRIIASTTGYIIMSGTLVSGVGSKFIILGDNADFNHSNIILRLTGPAAGSLSFDDGEYPSTELYGNSFNTNFTEPTSSIYNKVIFQKFKEAVAGTWVTGGTRIDNVKKTFEVIDTTNFALLTTKFDTGDSRWILNYDANTLNIPVDGDYNNYPDNFRVHWYNLEINKRGGGNGKALIPARRSLQVNSLTIGRNAKLVGEFDVNGSSTVCSTTRPTILGSWNFKQIADGIYSSTLHNSYPITPSHGGKGYVQFSNDGGSFMSALRLYWDIDTNSLQTCDGAYMRSSFYEFCQSYGTTAGTGVGTTNRIWISNGTPSVPYFTDSNGVHHNLLAGGGGGGGTDELVKIDAVDPTAGYLTNKILAGTGISLSLGLDPTFGSQMTINNTGLTAITMRDEGVGLGNITTTGTLDFVGAGVTATTTGAGDFVITIPGGGGGGGSGGYPLFRHDDNPTTHNFKPFRLLADGDTIKIGQGTTDVSVFSPTLSQGSSIDTITADNIGSGSTNTGREYIFYGQLGKFGSVNHTKYKLDTVANTGVKTFWLAHMGLIGGGILGSTPVASELIIIGLPNTSNVRVIDAGEHDIIPLDFSAEEPGFPEPGQPAETCRLLLIEDYQYYFDAKTDPDEPLFPNFVVDEKLLPKGKGGR